MKQSCILESASVEECGVNLEHDECKPKVGCLAEEDVENFLSSVYLDIDKIFLDGNTTRWDHGEHLKVESFLLVEKLKSLNETLSIRNEQVQVIRQFIYILLDAL